ncbi:hypothetical protein AVEN_44821-1 [Araneus ventricosus]|uniref:Uncharacterized protein n=1 Tax=Araneus ventricosus TaxID=182803 RepID=A0A4Y2CJX8_ARAVE|nr:hypothetical protein AVEN_44821-1 [Araneus ventricosus]
MENDALFSIIQERRNTGWFEALGGFGEMEKCGVWAAGTDRPPQLIAHLIALAAAVRFFDMKVFEVRVESAVSSRKVVVLSIPYSWVRGNFGYNSVGVFPCLTVVP